MFAILTETSLNCTNRQPPDSSACVHRAPDDNKAINDKIDQLKQDPAGRRGLIPLTRIVHVAVDVTDLDQAEYFYAAGVGFALSYRGTTADGLKKSVLRLRAGHVLTLQRVDTIPERAT